MDQFKMCLSYEIQDDIFSDNNNNYVDYLFNIFLNRYLQVFNLCFPKSTFHQRTCTKPWITNGIKIFCQKKRDPYLMTNVNGNTKLKQYYKLYCEILSEVI